MVSLVWDRHAHHLPQHGLHCRRHQLSVHPHRLDSLLRRWHLLGPVHHVRGLHPLPNRDLWRRLGDNVHLMHRRHFRRPDRLQRVPVLRLRDNVGSGRGHVLHHHRLPHRPVQIQWGLHQLSSGQIQGHDGRHRGKRLRDVHSWQILLVGGIRVQRLPNRQILS